MLCYILLRDIGVGELKFVNITDEYLFHLSRGCRGLITISLFGCRNITDAGVIKLAEGCRGLTSIDLGNCKNITDAGVIKLAEGCPGLTISRYASLQGKILILIHTTVPITTSKVAVASRGNFVMMRNLVTADPTTIRTW